MYKLMVITNPDAAIGFSLAGVQVIAAATAAIARQELVRALNDDRAGVIAMDEDYYMQIDDMLQAKMEKLYRPIVIPIPSKKEVEEVGGHGHLASFIRRAVGFDIKLRA